MASQLSYEVTDHFKIHAILILFRLAEMLPARSGFSRKDMGGAEALRLDLKGLYKACLRESTTINALSSRITVTLAAVSSKSSWWNDFVQVAADQISATHVLFDSAHWRATCESVISLCLDAINIVCDMEPMSESLVSLLKGSE